VLQLLLLALLLFWCCHSSSAHASCYQLGREPLSAATAFLHVLSRHTRLSCHSFSARASCCHLGREPLSAAAGLLHVLLYALHDLSLVASHLETVVLQVHLEGGNC
jgi:hypothetical protein